MVGDEHTCAEGRGRESSQLRRSGLNPGGDRPILISLVAACGYSRMHPGRPRDVFSQTLLGGVVGDANAVVDTETGVSPG